MTEVTEDILSFTTNEGTIRSVSFCFFHKDLGYVVTVEDRNYFGKLRPECHLIGGKVEEFDDNPFMTGYREFLEETLCSQETAVNIINCDVYYYDLVVSEKKKLINRFYFIDITYSNELIDFFMNWKTTEGLSIRSLFFWKKDDPLPEICSSLLKPMIDLL